jgi:glycosyltransferase involved in cell wall biosynthesis
MGREAHLLTHGVDLEFWTHPGSSEELSGLDRHDPPYIVFWGIIDRRMDVAFLRRLSEDLTRGTILLVGPQADPDPDLLRLDKVAHLPPVPFEQLPHLAGAASVLVMPYADLPVTRAMQPLKLKEYLATGKPVVARSLPACREWQDCMDLAEDPASFSAAVRARLETGVPREQASARQRLTAEGWAGKARQFAERALAREELAAEVRA